jgi:hypothetical protein
MEIRPAASGSAAAVSTSCTASGIVMKYRVTSGCVTVSGPPAASCRLNSGMTLPSDPSTLPKRTTRKSVAAARSDGDSNTVRSAIRFVAPSTLVGLTALSVEMSTNLRTPCCAAHWATRSVPTTLFHTASDTFVSSIGTCLYAAAWNT